MNGDVIKLYATRSLLEHLMTRDNEGNRLHLELGEPDADGFHTATVWTDMEDNPFRPTGNTRKVYLLIDWNYSDTQIIGVYRDRDDAAAEARRLKLEKDWPRLDPDVEEWDLL